MCRLHHYHPAIYYSVRGLSCIAIPILDHKCIFDWLFILVTCTAMCYTVSACDTHSSTWQDTQELNSEKKSLKYNNVKCCCHAMHRLGHCVVKEIHCITIDGVLVYEVIQRVSWFSLIGSTLCHWHLIVKCTFPLLGSSLHICCTLLGRGMWFFSLSYFTPLYWLLFPVMSIKVN